MVRKILSLILGSLLVISCAAPSAPPTTTESPSTPRPSPTLERAPTRGTGPNSTSVPLGASPAPPPQITGKLAYSPGDGSLWTQDASTGEAHPVVTPSPDLFADAPAFSPDGAHIAYTQSSLTAQGVAENS